MRIIINECKKILDIRIILLLCMFSILYYMTFTQIYRYPTGGQLTNTKYATALDAAAGCAAAEASD